MREPRRVPGEEGIWVLIGGELLAFSAFFLIFTYYRGEAPDVFTAGRDTLNRGIGLINTVVLLTSSLFVALGVRRAREERPRAALLFNFAILCGFVFVALKVFEYTEKIRIGLTPLTNDFYTYYFAFTGTHLLHVLIGLVALSAMTFQANRRPPSAMRTMIIECGAIFWHLVDLLWIMLFTLFYLSGDSRG